MNQEAAIIKNSTYIGFDFGVKKIGVAVGQLETGTASPLETLAMIKKKPDWAAIDRLIGTWKPTGFVVGICNQQDGAENAVTPYIRRFCRQLEDRYQSPVHCVDESYTTFEAKQLLFDDLKLSATKLWQVQDQLAAQLILQTWLNEPNQNEPKTT